MTAAHLEAALAYTFEHVDYAYREGVVGSDDIVIYFGMGEGKLLHGLSIHVVHIDVLRYLRRARVALHAVELIYERALFEGEKDGMLPAAVAYDEYVHCSP